MRDWLYRSGDIWLPRKYVDVLDTYVLGNSTSLMYINYWSGMHFLSGVIGSFLTSLSMFHVIHFLWELWQIFIGMTPISMRGGLDICMDTLFAHLGYSLGKLAK
jgi:hypothetical protein